jgi:hypothetical protein
MTDEPNAAASRSLRLGLKWGGICAAGFTVAVAAVLLLQGREAHRAHHRIILELLAGYAVLWLAGGAVVGALWPRMRSRLAAVVVCALAGILGFGGLTVAVLGVQFISLVFTLFAGIAIGARVGLAVPLPPAA